jgi:hypothetical protein
MQLLSDASTASVYTGVLLGFYTSSWMQPIRWEKTVNHRQLSYCPETPASEASGLLGAIAKVFRVTRGSKPLVVLLLAVMMLGLSIPAANGQTVINYPNGFGTSVNGQIWLENFATCCTSGSIHLVPSMIHNGSNAWFETPENEQAFTTTFTFHIVCTTDPSDCGGGFGFMMICACMGGNNTYNPGTGHPGYTYQGFSGAQFSWSQCEVPLTPASEYCFNNGTNGNTGAAQTQLPDNIIVTFNNYDNGGSGSAGASLTAYVTNGTFPAAPVTTENNMAPSGINLNSGDEFSATLTYNGSTLTESLTDTVTKANYTHTYTGVNIPSAITGNTAFIGFGGGTGAALDDVYLDSWTYTVESPGQAATPTLSPAAGTYSGAQSVTLASASSGAVICYNTTGSPATNGSTGCATGTLYTGPVTVSSSETLYAVAGGTGYGDSPVGSGSYVIQSAVSTPVFSPTAGTYGSAQSVTVSDATANATIYYTTNGTTPTTSSTMYTGPITVSSTEKLEAIAVATGDTNSAVASAAYTITSLPTVSTPAFSPATGTYNSAQSVSISDATSGATIYYTTDGTTPTTSSTEYAGPITVSSTEKLEAIAVAPGNANSAVSSAAYTINLSLPSASTPTFSPAAGSYTAAQSVTISDATSGAAIYYTTNGTAPTTSSTEYTGPITVSSTETLDAIAVATGDANSTVASAAYTITSSLPSVSTPIFSPAAGPYTAAQSVVLSDATSGATIYYTTDGTTPTVSSTKYTGPVTVSSTETLQAIAAASGYTNSAVTSAAYTITTSLPSVSTPAFSPAAGSYNSAQSVSISDATSGATIFYTTNGSTPTASSTAYTGPITVSSTETLQAIAVATGDSAIASAAYTITAPQPNFLLAASSSALTVSPGGQGALTLTVTPENGFDSAVVLACSGLPAGATCSFDQPTVTPSGGAVSTQLIISTSTQSSVLQPGAQTYFPMTALAMTVGLFGWRKRRGWRHWLLLAVAYAGLGLLFGCSGNSGAGGTTNTPAVSNTSTVTVTAISGTLQGKANIALTVD